MAAAHRADLGAFLDRAAATPFAWGVHDCALLLADWAQVLTGVDPAAHLRGRYATRRGCARVLQRGGGIVAVVGDCAARAGFDPVAPECIGAGDVGVVQVVTADGAAWTGAVALDGHRWAVASERGLVIGPAPVAAAWSFAPTSRGAR